MHGRNDQPTATGQGVDGDVDARVQADRLSEGVVEAVAAATGEDPASMPSLYEVLDPDALDALFRPGSAPSPPGTGRVSFRYNGCDVTVHADGRVLVARD
ncbi:HalOD1 output domain-containing protein [Halobacterium yunchengense]|uniref:HalOD1 output domain-containing protein n=1 Tax=Halobacterium yunchengense TaxID=3108497 RepID=UPI00300BAF26